MKCEVRLNSAPTLIYRQAGPCAPFVIHPLPVNARIQLSVPKQLLQHPSNAHSPAQSTSPPTTNQITARPIFQTNTKSSPNQLPVAHQAPPTYSQWYILLTITTSKPTKHPTNTPTTSPSASSPPQQPQPPPLRTSAPPPPPASTTPSATT